MKYFRRELLDATQPDRFVLVQVVAGWLWDRNSKRYERALIRFRDEPGIVAITGLVFHDAILDSLEIMEELLRMHVTRPARRSENGFAVAIEFHGCSVALPPPENRGYWVYTEFEKLSGELYELRALFDTGEMRLTFRDALVIEHSTLVMG